MRNNAIARPLALCLAALLLLLLSACAAGKGSTTDYGGFTVHTERARQDAGAAETRALPPTDRAAPGEAADYVLNMSSEKFHYPSCSAVKEISEKNRWDYHGSREDVIEMGYQPCKLCNP